MRNTDWAYLGWEDEAEEERTSEELRRQDIAAVARERQEERDRLRAIQARRERQRRKDRKQERRRN